MWKLASIALYPPNLRRGCSGCEWPIVPAASDARTRPAAIQRSAIMSGRQRVVLQGAGGLFATDVSQDGRLLVVRSDVRSGIIALSPKTRGERDLSWLSSSWAPFLSADGHTILITEEGSIGGVNYALCTRETDARAPILKQASGRGTTKQGPKTSSVPAAWGPRRRSAWRSKPARAPRSVTPAAGVPFKGGLDVCWRI